MIISEIGHFQDVAGHEFTSKCINHVVVVERDEQGVVVEKQAKLGEIKIHILHLVYTSHDIDILIVYSIAIFQ